MAVDADLFPGAVVTTPRISIPDLRGRVVERSDAYRGIRCHCGCGSYWVVAFDFSDPDFQHPHNLLPLWAHDLDLADAVDQLAARVEQAP